MYSQFSYDPAQELFREFGFSEPIFEDHLPPAGGGSPKIMWSQHARLRMALGIGKYGFPDF
jgi:hypothetical protein